jgi:hypothetical protein
MQKNATLELQDIKKNLHENRFQEEWFGEIFSSEEEKIF